MKEELNNYPLSDEYVADASDIRSKLTADQSEQIKKIYAQAAPSNSEFELIKVFSSRTEAFAKKEADAWKFEGLAKAFDEAYQKAFDQLATYAERPKTQ